MPSIDISVLINWIISGFIGLFFGIISAWFTHRYEKKRDDIAWEREKEKLKQQFDHEVKMLEAQHQQKMIDFERQLREQRHENIRKELLRGVDDAENEIKKISSLTNIPIYHSIHAGMPASSDFDEPNEFDNFHYDIFPLGTYTFKQIWMKIASSRVGWVKIQGIGMNAAQPVSIDDGDFVLVSFEQETKSLADNTVALISLSNNGEYNLSLKRYKESSQLLISESTLEYAPLSTNEIRLIGIALCVAKRN